MNKNLLLYLLVLSVPVYATAYFDSPQDNDVITVDTSGYNNTADDIWQSHHGNEIFASDLETGTIEDIFDTIDLWGNASISSEHAHSGNKSLRIKMSVNEDGSFLGINMSSTPSLFTRKFEYYALGWEGNWPVGLKTSRYFTTPDQSLSGPLPGGYAYMSEKLIWQGYDGNPDDEYARGFNNAIYDQDIVGTYPENMIFGNGLPYIRTGHWYKMETWMVLNSAVDVPDGVLQVWIDDQLVLNRYDVMWKSTARGVPNGDGWQSMWFGGNYSGAIFGDPTETIYRYIDDLYLSTSLDRNLSDYIFSDGFEAQ